MPILTYASDKLSNAMLTISLIDLTQRERLINTAWQSIGPLKTAPDYDDLPEGLRIRIDALYEQLTEITSYADSVAAMDNMAVKGAIEEIISLQRAVTHELERKQSSG